jgi:hypothetical protein
MTISYHWEDLKAFPDELVLEAILNYPNYNYKMCYPLKKRFR